MKEPKLSDSLEVTKEFFGSSAMISDDEREISVATGSCNIQLTELRRRIEERLDSKRIASEFSYDNDDDSGNLQ
ncbi:MAG TPA: hypothetical protein EYG31_01140 [Porticoccaceae bacterium]|jgi:hypothetical protein|nr:hypothetical protein [Gammaproteobacteria bacterium]HIL59227.1 hypothetical protein [Porticoccaceae bacterium]